MYLLRPSLLYLIPILFASPVVLSHEIDSATAGDNFGAALSTTGDINKDGNNDIAVGSPKYDVPSISTTGKPIKLLNAGQGGSD